MKYRIFYSNAHDAKDKGWQKQGTVVEINSMGDLIALAESFNKEVIIGKNNLPDFIYNYCLWGKDKTEWKPLLDEDDIESYYLLEMPTEDWVSDQWIEVYNGYRE